MPTAWSADSRQIYGLREADRPGHYALTAIDIETMKERVINPELGVIPPASQPIRGLALMGADSLVTSVASARSDIWMAEGLELPGERCSRACGAAISAFSQSDVVSAFRRTSERPAKAGHDELHRSESRSAQLGRKIQDISKDWSFARALYCPACRRRRDDGASNRINPRNPRRNHAETPHPRDTAVVVHDRIRLLFACGDKFFLVGRGDRFSRAYATLHPGQILIYTGGTTTVSKGLRDARLHKFITRAGHHVVMASDRAELDRALKAGSVDVVLAGLGQAVDLVTEVGAAPSRPTLLAIEGDGADAAPRRNRSLPPG